ncbi:MAG: MFS transporter [Flavobacteriia bacterium]|nr:MFS transporter [Flavobacteriia bacterium]
MENKTFTSYQKFVITILALTQFSVVLDFMVLSPLGDELIKTMDLSPKQFGIVVAAYSISAGLSGFFTAGFADSFDRKKLLLFFYVGFILGTLFCGLATNYYYLIIARFITGIFGGVIGSISMAIVADIFALQQRGRVMGFLQMGFGASQVMGIPISLALTNVFNWKAPFFLIVGISIIVWILIFIKIKPIREHLAIKKDHSAYQHILKTLTNKNYHIGFLAAVFLSMGGFLIMPWGSTFSRNNLHVTKEQLPLLFMVVGLFTLIVMPIFGKLSDKINKVKLFTFSTTWMVIMVLIYTNLHDIPFWLVVLTNLLMMMGVMTRIVPSNTLITSLPEMQDRGAFMSIYSSLQYLSGGIAAAVGGLIIHQKTEISPIENFNILGIVMIFIAIICVWLIYKVNIIVEAKKATENS